LRRRTTTGRVTPAGSSRNERLDPLAHPLQRELFSPTGDEWTRVGEFNHKRAAPRHAVRNSKMALRPPLAAYRGVAIRMEPPAGEAAGAVAVVLEHSDPALSRTLYRATHGSDVIAEWRAWGRVLSLPLLVTEADGGLHEPFARIGAVRAGRPILRRRKRSSLKARRPARRQGAIPARPVVHRGERELIARG
jgi:Family of unknown function (DUF6101)